MKTSASIKRKEKEQSRRRLAIVNPDRCQPTKCNRRKELVVADCLRMEPGKSPFASAMFDFIRHVSKSKVIREHLGAVRPSVVLSDDDLYFIALAKHHCVTYGDSLLGFEEYFGPSYSFSKTFSKFKAFKLMYERYRRYHSLVGWTTGPFQDDEVKWFIAQDFCNGDLIIEKMTP
jgi:hypothetical protein